jgi:hypothetical protein
MSTGGRHGCNIPSAEAQHASRYQSASRNLLHPPCTLLLLTSNCRRSLHDRHRELSLRMRAVQLLDFLSVPRLHQKHSRGPTAAAQQGHWRRSLRSAVMPAATTPNFTPASHSTLQAAYQLERYLRLLITRKAQGVLADGSALAPHSGCPPTGLSAATGDQTAAGLQNDVQHHLSRWPWSMLGKEVRVQDSPSHICVLLVF